MRKSHVLAALLASALAAGAGTESRAQVAAGAAVERGWTWHWPRAPYRYGWHGYGWAGPWGSCGAGACADDPYLRRAIRRELEQHEYQRELEERARRGFLPSGPLQVPPRDWPPATPESQVQPAYRGSGEIRPEFSRAGEPREDSAAAPR